MSLPEVFNANSHIYATAVNERFYIQVAAALAGMAAARFTPRRILEVGAGTGAATVVLKRYFPEAEILATDASEKMLEHNLEKRLEGVRYAPLRIEEVPCCGETFDLIFGNICYHWFPPGTASHLSGLLHPDGVMAFSLPITGGEKENGNHFMMRICRELGRNSRQGQRLPGLNHLKRQFSSFSTCLIQKITLRETHPPAVFGTLLRARGSWTFLFGPHAPLAESLWRKYTAGLTTVTLCWNIALVVAEKFASPGNSIEIPQEETNFQAIDLTDPFI